MEKIWIGDSFIWKDEELDCIHFKKLDDVGCVNCCIGNAPYSCHRAKREGLCRNMGLETSMDDKSELNNFVGCVFDMFVRFVKRSL